MYNNEENETFRNFYEENREAPPAAKPVAVKAPKPRKKRWVLAPLAVGAALSFTLAVGILGGYIGATYRTAPPAPETQIGSTLPPTAQTTPGRTEATAVSIQQSTGALLTGTQVFEKCNAGVVAISTELVARNVFGQTTTQAAAGSGFIISSDGYIITNHHVISNATKINVILHDGTKLEATLVGSDEQTDIAVLKVDANNLTALEFGDSSVLKVGDIVYAIGNPLGELANTMTDGIVSALDREINIDGEGSGPMNLLQTNAAISPGNSGGPLINTYGQVIGIVNAKSISSGVEGLGFAIPVNDAQTVINDLMENGQVTNRASLNITASDFYRVMGNRQMPIPGAGVYSVDEGGAAEKAGVKENDVIVAIDDTEIASRDALILALRKYKVGDTVKLTVDRDGSKITLDVTLGAPTQPDVQQEEETNNSYNDPFGFFNIP